MWFVETSGMFYGTIINFYLAYNRYPSVADHKNMATIKIVILFTINLWFPEVFFHGD